MHILLTGADGLIGRRLAAALQNHGHEVLRVVRSANGRDEADTAVVDFAAAPAIDTWRPLLAGMDAVVNTVGIFRESPGQRFRVIHGDAPMRLFDACVEAGIACVIQFSALGADAHAESRFHLSKCEADEHLRSLPLNGAIIQPSLIYAPDGTSARMFNRLASLPLLALPCGGRTEVQPVHVDDVIAGVLALLEKPPRGIVTLPFVGPHPLTLRDYLQRLRRGLGLHRSPLRISLPMWLASGAARWASLMRSSLLNPEALQMLVRGNTGPAEPLMNLIRRPTQPVSGFIPREQAEQLRQRAILDWGLPLLRWAIALVWIWTGLVSLGLYPVELSYALLARVGVAASLAPVFLYGAALLDLALGWLTLRCPASMRAPLWMAQLALIAAYTLIISFCLPEYWLHPYGPILKNLPMMAAIFVLWAFDTTARRKPKWNT